MDTLDIYKYNRIDINNIQIYKCNIEYNFNDFLIQSPMFTDYDILNYNTKKYLELKFNDKRMSHIKFLTLIHSLELKMDNITKNLIKTQIITDIQNKKSLKIKLLDDTKYFDTNKNQISKLSKKKITLLLKLDFQGTYYSWMALQILQLN